MASIEHSGGSVVAVKDVLAAAAIMVGTLLEDVSPECCQLLNELVETQGEAFPGAEAIQRASRLILREINQPTSTFPEVERGRTVNRHRPDVRGRNDDAAWSLLWAAKMLVQQAHVRLGDPETDYLDTALVREAEDALDVALVARCRRVEDLDPGPERHRP